MEKDNIKMLSASRIKTLETCTWSYWCHYHEKLPSKGNDGSSRGTACHLVLEMLLNPKHKHHFKKITNENTIYTSPSIVRLLKKSMTKDGFYSDENLSLCNDMIIVGLLSDFFGKGGKIINAEEKFLIDTVGKDGPQYKVMGFIDKPIQYAKNKRVKIVDYKTSKAKFQEAELDGNIQALVYSLAAKKMWPKKAKDVLVEFLFLRFPDQPSQTIEPSEDQIKGFEYYLEALYITINEFNKKLAQSNFAADQPMPPRGGGFKGPLNCGFAKRPGQLKKNGEPMWHCEYKFPFDYYILMDKNGEQIGNGSHSKSFTNMKKGQKVEKRHYEGCPAHKHLFENRDDFDF